MWISSRKALSAGGDKATDRSSSKKLTPVAAQTNGRTVILTKNEIEHARNNCKTSIIEIVHSVTVSIKDKNIQVSGGITVVKEQWQLQPEYLSPIQYAWTVT